MLYRKSGFLQAVSGEEDALIWHSLFGNPLVVSLSTLELLDLFEVPLELSSLRKEYEVTKEHERVIELLVGNQALIPEDLDERRLLAEHMQKRATEIPTGHMIDYLELIMSEACNFRCTYCIHFNNLEMSDRIQNPQKFMTFERAKETIEGYLSILRQHQKTTASINFGGGEPLLMWPVIREALEYCTREHGKEFVFNFSINTNASLITPEIASTLKAYRVLVAVSLDGLGNHNDTVRMRKSGHGTFEDILRGMDVLDSVGYPLDGFAATLNETNFAGLNNELVDWAAARQMKEIRVDIDVVDMVNIPVDIIVERLSEFRRYARSRGVGIPGFWARPFENLNYSTLSKYVAFCGAVRGNSMCVNPSGNIYGCGYSNTQLGSLVQIQFFHAKESNYHRFVRGHLTGAVAMCYGCMIEGQCAGGCNITQEFARATESSKIERMCEFYRGMTAELAREQLQDILDERRKNNGRNQKKGTASNVRQAAS